MNSKILKIFPFLLAFYEMIAYLSNDTYLPALPELAHQFNISGEIAQLTLTLWFMGASSMQLILGPLSDRYGRRPVLLIGGLFFVISTIICAISTDITLFLVARFIQGCAVCSVVVPGYSAIHELYDQKTAMRTLALMAGITVLAPAFGPLLGSLFVQFSNWRFIFYFLGLFAIPILLILLKWMPESLPPEKRHKLVIPTLIKNYKSVVTNKGFMLNALAFCCLFTGMIAWIATGPFLIVETFKKSPMLFGLYQIIIFGGFILGGRLVKQGIDRLGPAKLIRLGLAIGFSGAVLTFLSTLLAPNHLFYLVLTLTLFTFGNALALGPLQRLAVEASDAPMGGRMAIFSSLMSGSGVLGSILAGAFYAGNSSALGGIVLGSSLTAIFFRRFVKK